ncbi:DinB family protein [Ruania alkalisoli]|nr:DinB family protein [Ruania alkalisoli]
MTPMNRAGRRDHPPPRTGPSEKEVLVGFLDYLRGSVAAKVDGVPEPEVREPGVPSGTNLLGLIHHLTHVERALFLGVQVRSWPATFRAPRSSSVAGVVSAYYDAVDQSNAVIDACEDLAGSDWRPEAKDACPSLRWALTHMVEETGRHAGHADVLREQIDGRTGR